MEIKVRNYTDKELLDLVKLLPSFKEIPNDYWLLGVQSEEDTYNTFDDKIYLFHGSNFISVITGTTNAGSDGILNYAKEKLKGVFVWKTDEWYYDVWSSLNWDMKTPYLHKGKMKALRQAKSVKGYRDSNKNKRIEEGNNLVEGIFGLNFHTNTYKKSLWGKFKNWFIGGWSWGCVVSNDPEKYYNEFLSRLYNQKFITYVLIKEKNDK